MKILHLTTCHKFNDHRIFYKHSFAQRKLKHKVKIYAFDSKTINFDNDVINGIKVVLFQSKNLYLNLIELVEHLSYAMKL